MEVSKIYSKLLKIYGPQNWWPIYVPDPDVEKYIIQHELAYGIPYSDLSKFKTDFRDPYFEIATGAILAQNVNWQNAAQGVINLYKLKALTPNGILKLRKKELEKALIPTRYYSQKAKKLSEFCEWLMANYDGQIIKLASESQPRLKLLERWGIGKETADSILLYSLNLPMFVIDAYTKRLCEKFGIAFGEYDDYRLFFENALKKTFPKSKLAEVYKEYHALVVAYSRDKRNSRVDL